MNSRLFNFFAVLALTFILTPGMSFAAHDERGDIIVTNDWSDTAHVTLLMERHDEEIRTIWDIEAGERAYLTRDGGRRVRVKAHDRIKIKNDSRPVAIGAVGEFRDGEWHVRVRDVYQAQREREDRHRDHDHRDSYHRD